MTDGLVCKTNVAAHNEHNDCTRGIFRRVCVGCGVCETFASDKNEISTGHFGGGHVRENRAKIADLRKKKLLIRTTLRSVEWRRGIGERQYYRIPDIACSSRLLSHKPNRPHFSNVPCVHTILEYCTHLYLY
jgi:hypothetical protein